MKRVRFVSNLPLLALVCVTACGGPSIPPAQSYATITGRVFDSATNEPVQGAVITGSAILTATSAADGTYKIANFPIGPNEVQVTPPAGFTAAQSLYTISPQKGETLTIDIALKKKP
jgi:uncharacterized protein YfaP (DUF2135 family)